ncbi:hypothetical protein QQP08_008569 [Theobroma cacao]|nr:hypothetical protein QQP08_008569 [Theobroma cacao]
MGSLAHRKLAYLAASLGATRLMTFSLGTRHVIISSHLDTAREILSEVLRQQVADEMLVEVGKRMEEKGLVKLRGILQKGSLRNILESVFGSSECLQWEELGLLVKEGSNCGRKEKGCWRFNGGNDFLSALLALPKEDQLSDSDMVAILWMVLHQDNQAKVQQEIDTCIGRCSSKPGHLQDSDLPSLPYL